MKFCINCQSYIPPEDAYPARCAALIATRITVDLVDGTPIAPTFRHCNVARSTNSFCGEHAKLFQPKTTPAEIESALKEMYPDEGNKNK